MKRKNRTKAQTAEFKVSIAALAGEGLTVPEAAARLEVPAYVVRNVLSSWVDAPTFKRAPLGPKSTVPKPLRVTSPPRGTRDTEVGPLGTIQPGDRCGCMCLRPCAGGTSLCTPG